MGRFLILWCFFGLVSGMRSGNWTLAVVGGIVFSIYLSRQAKRPKKKRESLEEAIRRRTEAATGRRGQRPKKKRESLEEAMRRRTEPATDG